MCSVYKIFSFISEKFIPCFVDKEKEWYIGTLMIRSMQYECTDVGKVCIILQTFQVHVCQIDNSGQEEGKYSSVLCIKNVT